MSKNNPFLALVYTYHLQKISIYDGLGDGLWHCFTHITKMHLLLAKSRVARCRKRVDCFLQTCGWPHGCQRGLPQVEGVCCVIF
jgi:hypothetical protein